MIKNAVLSVILVLMLAGCSTSAKNLAHISPGMTKSQVINVLGDPESVVGQGNSEAFIYTLSNSWNSPVWNEKYYVQFENGIVESYGK